MKNLSQIFESYKLFGIDIDELFVRSKNIEKDLVELFVQLRDSHSTTKSTKTKKFYKEKMMMTKRCLDLVRELMRELKKF